MAFMSRTLNAWEMRCPAIEKEATAIIEPVRRWQHFLKGRRFTLTTNQWSVSFILDEKNRGKIKMQKFCHGFLKLSQLSYDICNKPDIENVASDAF